VISYGRNMPHEQAMQTQPEKRRGRPPSPPRTSLARWLQQREMRVVDLEQRMRDLSTTIGLLPSDVPSASTLRDSVNGRSCPSAPVMLLIRHVTAGEIDLEHWVRDLFCEH